MKLRNKKTGEILEEVRSSMVCKDNFRIYDNRTDKYFTYNSLAELNAEWEDAPEKPKEHYFISEYGEVFSLNEYEGLNNVANPEDYKQIGNYFETAEEAEKAVEKLKAWKRLKDKGFRIKDFYRLNDCACALRATFEESWSELYDDLLVLFGGEE